MIVQLMGLCQPERLQSVLDGKGLVLSGRHVIVMFPNIPLPELVFILLPIPVCNYIRLNLLSRLPDLLLISRCPYPRVR
jgi:hypothetical protein